jgi:GNAT superfamily N-acetyltransferase
MGYTLRQAGLADLQHIMRHRRQMFYDMGFTDAAALESMRETSEPLIARGLAEGFYLGWLAETDGGQVVAGGGVYLAPWPSHPRGVQTRRAEIVNVYTEPEHRRRGLARLLMSAMLDWCRASGLHAVVLHASGDGRQLYESLGFTQTNEMSLRFP